MTNTNGDRIDRIEALLERSIASSVADRQESNERMTRLEQSMERHSQESNERMTRLEQSMERHSQESNERMTQFGQELERLERVVASNNKFPEAFSTDLRRYTETLNNFATRIDSVIATTNQDRQDSNTRLSAIQR